MMKYVEQLSQFWQGVAASIVATVIFAIVAKILAISLQPVAKQRSNTAARITDLQKKLRSTDSVYRVEAYFVTLFTVVKLFAIAASFAVVAWLLTFYAPLWLPSVLVLAGLVTLYRGLYWLHAVMKEPAADQVRARAEGHLVIKSAIYSAQGHNKDVTQKLRENIVNDQLRIYAGNQLDGDPCPGVPKELTVIYTYQNAKHVRSAPETETLSLP